MTSQRWNWLEDGVLPLHVIVVRLCWLWPWLILLHRWLSPDDSTPYLPLWAIPALLVVGALVSRLTLAQTASLRAARGWVAVAGLAAVLGLLWWQYARTAYGLWDVRWVRSLVLALTDLRAEVSPAWFTLVIAAAIWLRGVLDGQQRLRRDDIWRTFVTGVVALTVLLLATRLDPRGLPPNTDRWLVLMVTAGMSGLALASVELAHLTGSRQTGPRPQLRLNRDWVLSVALVVGGVLVLGLGVAALVTPATVAQVLGWVGFVFQGIALLLGYVLMALAYVVFLVLTPLFNWLQALIANAEPREMPEMGNAPQQLEELQRQLPAELPTDMAEPVRWLIFVAVAVVLAIVFALALRYLAAHADAETDETRESVFSTALLQEQWLALWRSWLQHLPHLAGKPPDPYLSLDGEADTRRAIRALYQAVLAVAHAAGRTRPPAHTPLEYRAQLSEVCPPAGEAWSTITDAYVAARYGLEAPSAAQVAHASAAWAQVQSTLAATGPATTKPPPDDPDPARH